jgi:hypothetical protein
LGPEENEKGYEIKWSILKQAKPSSGTRVCKLCLAEKIAILNAHKGTLLNKRSELSGPLLFSHAVVIISVGKIKWTT